jgi:D-alanyl-D-alanine-carboxypeptidase/D-alanyl-D-alanine-endopeptidase
MQPLTRRRAALALLGASVLAIHSAGAPAQAAAAHSFPEDSAILAILRTRVDAGRSPGIIVGLLENGRTRFVAYGSSGRADGVLDEHTVFEIGSITKVFTGTLLADMARRGEVALDDPVRKHLPRRRMPSYAGRQITLEDLAIQHSGLPRLPDNMRPADPRNPYADYPVDSMLAFLSRYTLTRAPGAQFEYSNLGVGLLGEALARRARMSYEELVTERILRPLGMRDTRVTLTSDMRRRLAIGHDQSGTPTSNWDILAIPGAGALRSTAADMLVFAAAALGAAGPLQDAFAEAQRPRKDLNPAGRGAIGLNWLTMRRPTIQLLWHNGGTGGYRSYLGLDRATGRGVIVLTNSQNGADDIGRHLLDASLPLDPIPQS